MPRNLDDASSQDAKEYKLRAELVAAALGYASSSFYLDVQNPGPYDDAEMELKQEILEKSAVAYASALTARHVGDNESDPADVHPGIPQ